MSTILTLIIGSAVAWIIGELAMLVAWPFLTIIGWVLWWANDKLSWRFERWLMRRIKHRQEG